MGVGVPAEIDQRDSQVGDAEPEEEARVPGGPGLEEEYRREHEQHRGQNRYLGLRAKPDLLPQLGLGCTLVLRRRRLGGRGFGSRRHRHRPQIGLRQLVTEVEGGEELFDRPDLALDQKLDAEGLGRIEPHVRRNPEDVRLREFRRARCCNLDQPLVHAVAEADRDVALDQHDPVEDAAADIARALEAVETAPDDDDRVFARFQPVGEVRIFRVTQDGLADGRDRDERGLHLDERGFGRLGDRALGPPLVLERRESRIHLTDVKRQPAERSVPLHRRPVLGRRGFGVDLEGRSAGLFLGLEAAEPQGARDLETRAHDGIVDHHDGDGGTRDDIDVMRGAARFRLGHQIEADIAGGHRLHLGIGDPDQNDRLGMLDERHADDLRVVVDRDHRVDRLAGISRRTDEVAGHEGPSDRLAALQHGRHGDILARGSESIGARHQGVRRNLGHIFGKHRFRRHGQGGQEEGDQGKEYSESCHRRASLKYRPQSRLVPGTGQAIRSRSHPAATRLRIIGAGVLVDAGASGGGPRDCGR